MNKKRAVALGLFDGLHIGHTKVLMTALQAVYPDKNGEIFAEESSVFTFSDETPLPKTYDGIDEKIITQSQKEKLLYDMGFDFVYHCNFADIAKMTAREFTKDILIKEMNASYAVCGYNFSLGRDCVPTPEFKKICEEEGLKLKVVSAVTALGQTVSSTLIRTAIKAGEIEKANRLLGYELFYELPVTHGLGLARELGAPTINQLLPKNIVKPMFGVYESYVNVGGKGYKGVTNVGVKPTVTADGQAVVETFLLEYDGSDLYGQVAQVFLVRFIRKEKKWSNLTRLKQAIASDVENVANS